MLNIAGTIQVVVDGFMGIIHKYVLEFIILGFCLLGVCWGIGYFANALYGMHFELASCWAGFTAIGGAGVLASRPCMEELEDRFGELIIFPSSIHEILVVSRRALGVMRNKNELTEMVRDINASTVKPFEQLADNVYLYRDGELSVF